MAITLNIGDLHLPAERKGYVEFCLDVGMKHGCDTIVFQGDLMDWGALTFHERNPNLLSASHEYKRVKKRIGEIKRQVGKKTRVIWLIGNHDALPERQAKANGLPAECLKTYNELWEVDWDIVPRFGSVKIDGVRHSHGEVGGQGKDAAIKQALENFRSTVIGHIHSEMGVKWAANDEFRVFGCSTGWGGDQKRLQFEYGRKFAKKGLLGCAVVKDGKTVISEPMLLKSR